MTLGEWLKRERESLGWSVRELGRRSKVGPTTVSALEGGRRPIKSRTLAALGRMAQAMEVSLIEAYHHAGLLDTRDEADIDAIEAARLVRSIEDAGERARVLEMIRGRERR